MLSPHFFPCLVFPTSMVSDVIGEIKVLKRKKDSDKALELLQRIAAEVSLIAALHKEITES